MGQKKIIEMRELGGISRAGNGLKIPFNKTLKAHNVLVRPGMRLAKRGGAFGESAPTSSRRLVRFGDTLMYGGYQLIGYPSGGYRDTGGVWQLANIKGAEDVAEMGGVLYALENATDISPADIQQISSPSGAVSSGSGVETVGGSTICAAVGRIFVGNATFRISNLIYLNTAFKFEDNTLWTPTNVTVAVVSNVRQVTVSSIASTPKLKTVTNVIGTTSDNQICLLMQSLKPLMSTKEVGVTLRLVDSAGVVYGSREVVLPKAGTDSAWHNYALEPTTVPVSGTNLYVEVVAGTQAIPAAVSDSFAVSEFPVSGSALNRGCLVKNGAYVPSNIPMRSSAATITWLTESWPYRVYFCDVDNTALWKSSFYINPGYAVKLIRHLNGFVYVFGDDVITVYQLTDNPNAPLAPTGLRLENIGCFGVDSWATYRGLQYFADKRNVYQWDGSGIPAPIVPNDLIEEVVAKATAGSIHALTFDPYNNVVYYAADDLTIYALNADTGDWTTISIAGPPSGGPALVISLHAYHGELFGVANSASTGYVFRLKKDQRRDNVDAITPYAVNAEYWLHTIETPAPAKMTTLETIELDHEVTYSQANSNLSISVSKDGGNTFDTARTRKLNLANGDSVPAKMPVRTTGRRQIIRLVHSGDAGEDAFNLNSVVIAANVHGDVKQAPNTT